jgi:hypothetical protein
MPTSNGSLVIAIKPIVKYTFHAVANLFYIIHKKYYSDKKLRVFRRPVTVHQLRILY